MRHRLALIAGSIAASGTLVVALAAAGFGPADPNLANAAATVAPTPRVQVDTIYVPAPVDPPTITVQRTVSSGGGDDENEAGGDD